MRALELNPTKIKVLLQFNLKFHQRDVIPFDLFPEVKKVSLNDLIFEKDINKRLVSSINSIFIFIFSMGKWKQYQASPLVDHDQEELVVMNLSNDNSLNSLQFMIDEKERDSFKRDLMLIQGHA